MLKNLRITSLVIIAVILLMLAAACGSDPVQNQNQQTGTSGGTKTESNNLYFVGEADYSPISFDKNGEAAGINVDIIKEACQRMGYKVKIDLVPWKRAQEAAKTGEADGFFSTYKSPEREVDYLFPAESLISENNILLVKKDAKIEFDGDVSKLKEYTFATLDGYTTLNKYISEGKIVKVDKSKSTEEALKKLLSGDHNVDIVVNTNYIIWDVLKKMGETDEVKELNTPLTINPSYLAFTKKKDMSAVAAKFDAEIKKMKQDGTCNKIIEKYIGK